jgi:hypothetical protein
VSILAILLTVLATVPRVHAQTAHVASPSAIDAALQQHVSSADADRADVLRVLEHPAVKEVAGRVGIDLRRATSAAATIDGEELRTIAAQARQAEQALAGGQSKVVISTTTIIIALLVVILIIVAVD